MSLVQQRFLEWLGRQETLDPIADRIQQSVLGLYRSGGAIGQRAKNTLHGVWLGHPLHPALSDVPIGAWTVAAAFDALELAGDGDLAPAADAAIGLGLISAIGVAASGITDWSAIDGRARRQGLAHASLNTVSTVLYMTSFLLRRGGRRPAARSLAFLAYGIAGMSAYIGGHLSYRELIGVNHAPRESLPEEYTHAMATADLPEDAPARATVAGTPIVLVRRGDRVHALADSCAHLGGPLSEGSLDGDTIICPWHGSRYSLTDGRVLDGPSTYPQPCYSARIRGDQVEVGLPAGD
jgi:nitrite reductase/ring-hydroxylating ferredoxin subunit/uncharacterized membrane protein